MPVFQYKGFNQQGKPVNGAEDAENERALRAALRREGILVTEAKESAAVRSGNGSTSHWKNRLVARIERIGDANTQNISIFTRQLATLLTAGIQLADALGSLLDQTERPGFKKVLSDVRTQVNEGKALSYALQQHPHYFGDLYVRMVGVGEASGNLEGILNRLAGLLESQNRLRSKVTSTMLYPVVMVVVVSIVLTLLMTTVVPQIASIFEDNGQVLPWNTSLLIFMSKVVTNYYFILFPGIALLLYGFFRWKKSKSGRVLWDRFKLRSWGLGPLVKMIAISRFADAASTMLGAGLPLLQTLETVENILGNTILSQAVAKARESIREGEPIAQTLKKSGEFPPLFCHMIAVGERSGQLEKMLGNIAIAYQSEVETKLARLTALMEPAMILGMGLLIGFIVFSVMGPIQQLNQAL